MTSNDAFDVLERWSTTSAEERRKACIGIIGHFDSKPSDLDTLRDLTILLADSGDRWTWPSEITPRVDVPSTGGPVL